MFFLGTIFGWNTACVFQPVCLQRRLGVDAVVASFRREPHMPNANLTLEMRPWLAHVNSESCRLWTSENHCESTVPLVRAE